MIFYKKKNRKKKFYKGKRWWILGDHSFNDKFPVIINLKFVCFINNFGSDKENVDFGNPKLPKELFLYFWINFKQKKFETITQKPSNHHFLKKLI